MNTKICKNCGIEKEVSFFVKKGNGYCSKCKECMKIYNKEYNQKYYKSHKEELNQKSREYNKNYVRPQWSTDKHREKTKQWKRKNKEHIREYVRKYDDEHREEKRDRDRKWRNNNRDKYREYKRKDLRRRMSNPVLKVELQLRNMINTSFRRKKHTKSKRLEEIVGLNSKNMVEYLLETFKDNYGREWDGIELVHIDHIIPLATAKTEEDVIKLCYYTNLQLLSAKDNMKKGSKL